MTCAGFKGLTLAMMLACLATGALAQRSAVVEGRVVDSNGDAISGARVRATQLGTRFILERTTDETGTFRIAMRAGAEYEVSVTAPNFGGVIRRVAAPADTIEIVLDPVPVAADISVSSSYLVGTTENLDDVSGAANRIDRQILENSRVFNAYEALRKVPGIHVRDEEGFGVRPNIAIRGLDPTRSRKVLLLEDGIPLSFAPYGDNSSYYHPPAERYESVEVVKGTSQIVYGPHTVGGVINYITPNPSERPTFSLKLVGGNRDFFNGSFTGSGAIGDTGLFASYTRKQGDGARPFISSKLNDLSTKVVHAPNERHSLTFKFTYFREHSNATASGLTEAEYADDPRGNIFRNDFFFGDRTAVSLSHTGVLTESLFVTTNAYASFFEREWWRQSSNSSQRPNRLNVDPDCLSLADLNTTCGIEGRVRKYQIYGVAPSVTWEYGSDTRLRGELRTGLRVHYEIQNRVLEVGDLPTSRSGFRTEDNWRRTLAYSGFVRNRFVFGDLAVTPGVRVEHIRNERENRITSPVRRGEATVTAVIPGIGITYSALPRTTIFAGVHRGFSPPAVDEIISNSGGVIELDSEESWNYEAGVRTNPVRGVSLEATAFRMDFQNQIVPASLAGGMGSALTNGGETLQQGLEFAAQIDTSALLDSDQNFYLRTAYTWLPVAEFRGSRFSTADPDVLITGNRLPYAPENLLTTSLGYAHPKGVDAFIENVYIGRQFGDDLNQIDPTANGQIGALQAQTYWNATVNYTVENWRTTFFVTAKNIFDRTFVVDRSRGNLPSSPRLMQAGVKFNF